MHKLWLFAAVCLAAPIVSTPVAFGQDAPAVAPGADAPSGARSLAGTRWRAADDGALFRELLFMPGMLSITQQDGSNVTFTADLTGLHAACLGYDGCVLTVTTDNEVQPIYFGTDSEGNLFHADCVGAGMPEGATVENDPRDELVEGTIIHRNRGAICWNRNLVPYEQVTPIRDEFEPLEAPGAE